MSGEHFRHRLIGALLGALVFALGALVLAGRHLGLPILFQFRPNWLPTQYNPALCLVALGVALIALAARRFRIAGVLGIVPVLLGAITLLTWLFDLHPGIDEIFFRHDLSVSSLAPGRMSPITALVLILGGVAVGSGANACRTSAQAVIGWTIGALIGASGLLTTLITLLQGDRPAIESIRFTYLSPHIGLGAILAGGAIMALTTAQRHSANPDERGWQLPVAAGVAAAVVSLALWQGFALAEAKWILEDTRFRGQQILAQLENDESARTGFFTQTALLSGKHRGGPIETSWVSDLTDLVRSVPWLKQITWLNLDGTVHYRAGDDLPAGLLAQSILPIPDSGGIPIGNLVFTTDLEVLLARLIGPQEHGYNLSFRAGSAPVYAWPAGAAPRDAVVGNLFQADVVVAGRSLRLALWPGPQALARQQALLPQMTLLFGLALSFLLMAALRYEAVSRQRATSIARARQLIEHEVEERRRAEDVAKASEERATQALAELRQILDQSQDLICTVNREGCFLVVSASSWRILGYRPQEMIGKRWADFVYPPDAASSQAEVDALRGDGVARQFENRAVHRSGRLVHLSWSSTWLPTSGTSYSIARDVTGRVRQDAVREGQRQVLQLIASGSPLQGVLEAICAHVEKIDPGAFCSALLVHADGVRLRCAAAPRLPADYVAAIDGVQIGPNAGSCGTAVWRKQLVIVHEIESDPLWANWRSLALRHGLKSCWSMPITGEQGAVIGAFAVYHHEPCTPETHEIEMIEAAARLASVAIERDEVQTRLLEGREQLEFARRIAQLGYWEAFLGSGRVVLSEDMLATLGLPSGEDPDFSRLLGFVVEEDRSVLTTARDAALRHDVPVDIEIRLQLPGGDLRYVHFRGRTVRRGDRFSVKLAGTVQDITARKLIELENSRLYAELEDRVRSRTRELEQSNRELEAFSYSVSHDLRAPLRAISGFSALLGEEYGPAIGTEGQHYVDRIIAGTVRMSALIDDLLELGRVSRIEIKRQPLDLSALASAVTGRLHERWPERVVDVEIQPELVAWGDLRLLEVVLENLLENAWKFTAGRPVGQLRIGTTEQLGEHTFFVSDNGVGFDPQYAANLFGVFQRLHAVSAFPGTGVGLATVQRILQRHGGRVWADAQTDRGATFYFTLP